MTVSVIDRRQSTFSILGAIGAPATYNIMRNDMRLMEALALARGITQANIPYLYVIRQPPLEAVDAPQKPLHPSTEGPKDETIEQKLDKALEQLEGDGDGQDAPALPAEVGLKPRELLSLSENGQDDGSATDELPPLNGGGPRWVYKGGKWVAVDVNETTTAPGDASTDGSGSGAGPTSPLTGRPEQPEGPQADPFGWQEVDPSAQTRIIAINLERLRGGDQRLNIIVRDKDVIHIPPLEIGEFYIYGEVRAPGVYQLTGRKITIKQALTAAGGFGPLAWPEHCMLIRRIGANEEVVIPINGEALWQGEQEDMYIKKDDVLAVGTSWQASFLAVLRNAFRFTYGAGFIYDRNFGSPLDPESEYTSERFKNW